MATIGKYPRLETVIASNNYGLELLRSGEIKYRYEIASTRSPETEVIETGLSGSGSAWLAVEVTATRTTNPARVDQIFCFRDADSIITMEVGLSSSSADIFLKILNPEYPGDTGHWLSRTYQASPATFIYGNESRFTYDKLSKLSFWTNSIVRIHRLVITVY